MKKIVINNCPGSFGLSDRAKILYAKKTKNRHKEFSFSMIPRDDSILVEVVNELGAKANDSNSSLKIIEIPDGVDWEIEERWGMEFVVEKHRTWR